MKKNGVKFSLNADVISRRKHVISYLENQLVQNTKTLKDGKTVVALTDEDRVRINKELTTLKSRLVPNTAAKLSSRTTHR